MIKRLTVAMAILLLAGAAALFWRTRPLHETVYSDADRIREPSETARPREVLWQPPVRLAEITAAGREDYEPRLSWDGLTLFLVRGKAGTNADIYVSTRSPQRWSDPQPLGEINSEHDDLGPEPSADGSTLYFYSNRPGGLGGYDLWMARRGANGWSPPTHCGPQVNTEFNDYGPALSPDGRLLYFASNRPRAADPHGPDRDAWTATVREDLYQHDYDLYTAAIGDAGFSAARPLDALNSSGNDGAPAVSPAGDFLYFSSDRAGGAGGFGLYRARRVADGFRPVEHMPPPVNSAANELDPGLAMGGYALYFSSDRPPPEGSASPASAPAAVTEADFNRPAAPPKRDYDVYYTASREVFRENVSLDRPPIDWAALWADIGPNLMWLLLSLLAGLALLAVLRDARRRRLSLLTRCLLLSLLAHMVFLFMSSFWEVTTGLATAVRREGRISVALAAPSGIGSITRQIRGGLSDVSAPAPRDVSAPRRGLTSLPIAPAGPTRLAVARHQPAAVLPNTVSLAYTEAPLPRTRELSNAAQPQAMQEVPPESAALMPLPAPGDAPAMARVDEPVAPTVTPAETRVTDRAPVAVRPLGHASGAAGDESAPLEQLAVPAAAVTPAMTQGGSAALDSIADAPLSAADSPAQGGHGPSAPGGVEGGVGAEVANVAGVPDPSLRLPEVAAAAPVVEESANSAGGGGGMEIGAESDRAPGAGVPRGELRLGPAGSGANLGAGAGSGGTGTALEQIPIAPTQAVLPAAQASLAPRDSDASGSAFGAANGDVTGLSGSFGAPNSEPTELALALPSAEPDRTESADAAGPVVVGAGPAPGEVIHMVRGRVTDEVTGHSIEGVRVRLDLPEGGTALMRSDAEGRFELPAGELPEHFALAASREGYEPASVNVDREQLGPGRPDLVIPMRKARMEVVALERSPAVHHLGNDRFEGQINSQFQRESEGLTLSFDFEITAAQLKPEYRRAELRLMTKGVQCPHPVRVNGELVARGLKGSPADGVFGDQRLRFGASMLQVGVNHIEIEAIDCGVGDIDDFEFVNLRVRLRP